MKKDFYIIKCLREIHRLNQSLLLEQQHRGILLILNTPGSMEHFMVHTDPVKIQGIFDSLLDHLVKRKNKGNIEFGYKLGRDDQLSFYVKDPLPASTTFDWTEKEYDAEADLVAEISESLQELGGRIWIENRPDACRTFWFTMDIRPPQRYRKKDDAIKKVLTHPDWKNRTILIVDDVSTNLMLIENSLLPTNARILGVDNGLKAVNAVKKDNTIDVVLMDVRMPVLDGYEATRRIKNIKPWLPVIAISAYPESVETEKWKRAGCDAFLEKPLNVNDLLNTVSILFENVSMHA